MNKLLPSLEEMCPITNSKTTFYDCGFNKEFLLLEFEKQLKVINDLVRQTILWDPYPNPENEVKTLIGNSHTAALASIDYLRQLGIGKNYKYVLRLRNEFDPQDLTSTHASVLVEDIDGVTYLLDATPIVGYNLGVVKKITSPLDLKNFEILDQDTTELLLILRTFMFKISKNIIKEDEFKFYIHCLERAEKIPSMRGFTSRIYELLAENFPSKAACELYINKTKQLNPYSKYLLQGNNRLKVLKLKQVEVWKNELFRLVCKDENKRLQLELAQNIYSEHEKIYPQFEKWIEIKGQRLKMSQLTPRFFYENGLNCIMIKPSAYHLGVRGTIREAFLKKGNGAINEYFVDLTRPTELTHIVPIGFSHTVAEECKRAYSGISDVILIKEPADKLATIKRKLRKELGKNVQERNVKWNDGEKIFWHPGETNLIHSTDNPSEANLHFLNGYPEQQVMTRFMYPNKNLEKGEW